MTDQPHGTSPWQAEQIAMLRTKRCATAVGEGAAVVGLVHEHLASSTR